MFRFVVLLFSFIRLCYKYFLSIRDVLDIILGFRDLVCSKLDLFFVFIELKIRKKVNMYKKINEI